MQKRNRQNTSMRVCKNVYRGNKADTKPTAERERVEECRATRGEPDMFNIDLTIKADSARFVQRDMLREQVSNERGLDYKTT